MVKKLNIMTKVAVTRCFHYTFLFSSPALPIYVRKETFVRNKFHKFLEFFAKAY